MRYFDRSPSKFPLTAISDYRSAAKKRLPKCLFAFLEGGAFDEVTIRKNREDFQHIYLKRRVLKDVSHIDLKKEILGQKLAFPLILAPVGFAGCYARQGEIAAARAAAKVQIPFSLSTVGIASIEEIAKHTAHPFWFQFYALKDKSFSLELLQRAQANCPVLLLTVDLPVPGARYCYNRSMKGSGFSSFIDMLLHIRWWVDVHLCGERFKIGNLPGTAPPLADLPSMRKWIGSQINQSFSWRDFEWVRANWPGKIIIKGILDPEDARLAEEAGADGIVVSNHGARHLDGTLSTIAALPKIRDQVSEKFEVLIDGGITSGLDIVKALALGADACMIGKPWIYGLAARGERGVSEILAIFQNELRIAMAHLGLASVQAINRDIICNPSLNSLNYSVDHLIF